MIELLEFIFEDITNFIGVFILLMAPLTPLTFIDFISKNKKD